MANWSDPRIGASQPTTTIGRDVAYDAGLRAHMLSVYNYMTSGVLLTGIVAMLFASWLGVLIFAGLTAYDTQRIKSTYFAVAGSVDQKKAAVYGALQLYLDFINMFLFLLRLFGSRN